MKLYITIAFVLLHVSLKSQIVAPFQLKNVDQQLVKYQDIKGSKLTVIDFWATWCKPCTKAMPLLNTLYEKYKDNGVNFVGINCDGPRSISKAAPLVSAMNIRYPILLDINSEVKNNINVVSFPTLVIVNEQNEVIWIHEGFISGDEKIIEAKITELLQ